MGIPSYFADIIKKYGNVCFTQHRNLKRLFLDLNCCIYGCKSRVEKDCIRLNITKAAFEEKLFKEITNTIIRLAKEAELDSTGELFIMIDGSVPLAKMAQQRDRRHNSVRIKEETNKILRK